MPVTSARFTQVKLLRTPVPAGVQLVEEFVAALGLVDLADGLGRRTQPFERAQESPIGLVVPAHVAGAAPSRLPEAIEAAVVADAEVRVRLDVVARELPEARPRVEEARPTRTHVGDRVAATFGRTTERGAQRVERVARLAVEHRFGNATGSESDLGH